MSRPAPTPDPADAAAPPDARTDAPADPAAGADACADAPVVGADAVAGDWDLIIATPIGTQRVTLQIRHDAGALTGTAAGSAESVPLRDLAFDGDRLTWHQSITRPLRLDLAFQVVVAGDDLRGTSKAGRLPRSKVSGTRRT